MKLWKSALYLFLVILPISTLVGNEYPCKFEGSFEEWKDKHLELISFFLPPSPTIIQAGGHYGNETLQFARHWPKSQIFSFEPNPHAFECLCSRTATCSNIKTYPLALNEYSGIAPFYVCYGSTGNDLIFEHASSLLKPSESMSIHYQGPIIDVECTVLDEWYQSQGVNQIDFLDLDVQGSELSVLKSSPQLLKNLRCIRIHTFIYPFREGIAHYAELKAFLLQSGFQLVAHWYREGLDGEAIFVRNDYFFNEEMGNFLKYNCVSLDTYNRYYEPFFKVYYDIGERTDSIKRILKEGLAYEGNIGIIIDELTRPGSVAVDIGAHIGVHAITMSRKVGPKGAVIAFEPNKKLYMELLNHFKVNHCTNTIAIAKGLADTSKKVMLDYITIKPEDKAGNEGEWIETMTLDSLNLNHISLIKMDIEMYEYFALKGAQETVLRNQPVIIFECWIGADYENSPPDIKENFDRVISLIESWDYEIYVIFNNDFIAFPKKSTGFLSEYKKKFRKLDLDHFDIGV